MNNQDERPISDADARRLRSTPVPPPDLQERTVATVLGDRAIRSVKTPTRFSALNMGGFIAALAALTIVPVVIAFGLGRAMAQRAPDLSGAYLLIESAPDQPPLTAQETAARVREYGDWARELRERNLLVARRSLTPGIGCLDLRKHRAACRGRRSNRRFFIVRAPDMNKALSIDASRHTSVSAAASSSAELLRRLINRRRSPLRATKVLFPRGRERRVRSIDFVVFPTYSDCRIWLRSCSSTTAALQLQRNNDRSSQPGGAAVRLSSSFSCAGAVSCAGRLCLGAERASASTNEPQRQCDIRHG